MIQTKMATAKVIPKNVQSLGTAEVKLKINNPTQPVNGPGNTGKNAPMIPKIMQMSPSNNSSISINFL